MKVFTPKRTMQISEHPQTLTDKTDKSPPSEEEKISEHPQTLTDKTDKSPFVSFVSALPGVNEKKQGGAPTFQDLFLLAAQAGFPEYRVLNHWVFIPEGREAWQRNLQAMLKTHPQDLPRVLAWLEADLRLIATAEEVIL